MPLPGSKGLDLSRFAEALPRIAPVKARGRVVEVIGTTAEAAGVTAPMGEICHIYRHSNGAHGYSDEERRAAEVVGFRDGRLLLSPLDSLIGVDAGSDVIASGRTFRVPVGEAMLGRVVDGLARPIDGKGPLRVRSSVAIEAETPPVLSRTPISEPFLTGIRSIDGLNTLGVGQRLGIFAGSGVGKSTVLGMIARYASSDVNVIALIGERGREVREFIEQSLDEAARARTVMVVATSDKPALLRIKAAWVATAIGEWFRDRGHSVLLMMDSLTRFAMAQREIGLAVGEPPAVRGYTPSVFASLPALLERAGTSADGAMTGLYTVLVEGDDLQEPISDTVRGVLDGHVVLSRALAQENHYPAVDVLASISRLAPVVQSPEHQLAAGRLRELLAVYSDARDLISIGAYQAGTDPDIDYMIRERDRVNAFLRQRPNEGSDFAETLSRLMTLAPPAVGAAGEQTIEGPAQIAAGAPAEVTYG